MKILLIEDEVKLGQFLCDGLAEAGHICDHFTDGSKGLEAAMTSDFDLIILDLMLPNMNGFEILTSLRKDRNTTPVLVLSALSDADKVIQALDLVAIDYMQTSISMRCWPGSGRSTIEASRRGITSAWAT